jgi:hypothetical protein
MSHLIETSPERGLLIVKRACDAPQALLAQARLYTLKAWHATTDPVIRERMQSVADELDELSRRVSGDFSLTNWSTS